MRSAFQDSSPAAVYATMLDEGYYHCSIRTMYRILEAEGETRERRDQIVHPVYQKPELLATAPNQLWSWDITKLLGPAKWTYFYLYVILDVFSRYVVGWMVADGESAALATRLIGDTCAKQQIQPGQLAIHADNGSSMRSKPAAFLMADLGVTKTHSRPHVSGTTKTTAIPASACSHPPWFTTVSRPRPLGSDRMFSMPPTWLIPNVSFANRRSRHQPQRRSGSTNPNSHQKIILSKLCFEVSQKC